MRRIEIGLEVHRAIENARESFAQTEDEILRRLLGSGPTGDEPSIGKAVLETNHMRHESAISVGQRTTGQWSVRVGDTLLLARNLREAYLTTVAKIAELKPGTLQELEREGDGRRRIVAREARALYPRSPHLAESHRNNWHRLGDWYVDLNLSRDQAAKRIRRACALAGLRYGRDLVIQDGLKAL